MHMFKKILKKPTNEVEMCHKVPQFQLYNVFFRPPGNPSYDASLEEVYKYGTSSGKSYLRSLAELF